jgi:hypothetical protein
MLKATIPTDELRAGYQSLRTYLLATAERMPEESYSFRPTSEIEAFGQRVAHIANGNYGTCTGLEGEGKALNAQTLTKLSKESVWYPTS